MIVSLSNILSWLFIFLIHMELLGGVCHENAYFTTWELDSPSNLSFVTSTFQIRIRAEVFNIPLFQERNSDFSFCVKSYLISPHPISFKDLNGSGLAQRKAQLLQKDIVYHECGLKVFDNNPIPAIPGVNHVSISLQHHPEGSTATEICHSEVTVNCCISENDTNTTQTKIEIEKLAVKKMRELFHQLYDEDIVGKIQRDTLSSPLLPPPSLKETQPLTIILGIKSSAPNLHLRNAIRNTYFQSMYRLNKLRGDRWIQVIPFFLIGFTALSISSPEVKQYLLAEKARFGDILTEEELPAQDNYFTLTDKVLYFLDWLFQGRSDWDSKTFSNHFLIVSDDDSYLHIPNIVNHLQEKLLSSKSYYAGEVSVFV